MLDHITSYLIQNRECALPSLGVFRMQAKSAELDIVNKQMLPPVEEVTFHARDEHPSTGLITYIARKKMITERAAQEGLTAFCNTIGASIQGGGTLDMPSIGKLQKNSEGNVYFEAASLPYSQPVLANAVMHPHPDHELLVGDKETTSVAMTEYLNEQETMVSSRWKIWALVLGGVALASLAYYFSTHSFSMESVGNGSRLF